METIYFDMDGNLEQPLTLRVKHVAQGENGVYGVELSRFQQRRIEKFMANGIAFNYPFVMYNGVKHSRLTTIGSVLKFQKGANV